MIKYKLKKTYPNSPALGYEAWYEDLCSSKDWQGTGFYDKHPEYWEKVKEDEYEILSFININTKALIELHDNGLYCCKQAYNYTGVGEFTKEDCYVNLEVHSVKRLSDNEIFTLGDLCRIKGCTTKDYIKSFSINKNGLSVYSRNFTQFIKDIEHVKKQKLFTTEDGVDIFEDGGYYAVHKVFLTIHSTNAKDSVNGWNYSNGSFTLFSTKEKAEEHIFLNTKSLSINDLKTLRQQVKNKIGLQLEQAAEQLVKSRIKL